MTNDELYMNEALLEAKKAYKLDEVPIGAVIVYKDRIIARAHNLREKHQKTTSHAEMLAIEKACEVLGSWRLEDCVLYVTVEPCPMCAGTAIQSRLKKIVYGAKDYKNGAHTSAFHLFEGKFNHNVEVTGGVFAQESSRLLKSFFNTLRNPLNTI